MGRKKQAQKIVGTLDLETDPFDAGRTVAPFAGCVYLDGVHHVTWGNDCIADLCSYMETLPECVLYAHNGGKFDFLFLLNYAKREKVQIINGRIASMRIGNCKLVDSFLLMPFPLAAYDKIEIDYNKFLSDKREKNKPEIIEYLKSDCTKLYTLITGFMAVTGDKLTIGGASFAAQKKAGVVIPQCGEGHDTRFRKFYFGGRCQNFVTGLFENTPYNYYDINSAYPAAMLLPHPSGGAYSYVDKFKDAELGANFVTLKCISHGVFPVRIAGESLQYPDDGVARIYNVTGHELRAALETDKINIIDIIEVRTPKKLTDLSNFVNDFFARRDVCAELGDLIGKMAFKFLLNSGYGKYATDPRKFKDWILADTGDTPEGYDHHSTHGEISIWCKSSYHGRGFYDVATAASITGAVRATLWRALCVVDTPYYCDTDSIICRNGDKLPLSKKLGEWKIEETGTEFAVGGKKIYGLITDKFDKNGEKIRKTACKGARLNYNEIVEVAKGGVVEHLKDAPSFSIRHGQREIKRKIGVK